MPCAKCKAEFDEVMTDLEFMKTIGIGNWRYEFVGPSLSWYHNWQKQVITGSVSPFSW